LDSSDAGLAPKMLLDCVVAWLSHLLAEATLNVQTLLWRAIWKKPGPEPMKKPKAWANHLSEHCNTFFSGAGKGKEARKPKGKGIGGVGP